MRDQIGASTVEKRLYRFGRESRQKRAQPHRQRRAPSPPTPKRQGQQADDDVSLNPAADPADSVHRGNQPVGRFTGAHRERLRQGEVETAEMACGDRKAECEHRSEK
jgi:hypothetical protein